jgi:hypothetical protein
MSRIQRLQNDLLTYERHGNSILVRPKEQAFALFTSHRGAHVTSQEAARRYFQTLPGPFYELVGMLWPSQRYLNKVSFVTGRPGSGKSTILKMLMQSLAHLFTVNENKRFRWLQIDPTDTYLPWLYQILPLDVEILRVSPQDADGLAWDIAKDVVDDLMNQALQTGLFPEALFQKTTDTFWYTKAREATGGVVTVYHDRGSAWLFHDLVIPIKYPQFLRPLLKQSIRTSGMADSELVGRLGRDLLATTSSVINKMAVAAAYWRNAKKLFTLKDFLNSKSVMHLAYSPDMIPVLSGLGNAMTNLLILMALKRKDEHNHTILFCDESRYMSDLAGIDHLAAFGRASGLGAVILAQGLPGLLSQWGEKRTRELLDLVCTWITLSSGQETAQAFSHVVGQIEGLQESYGYSWTSSFGRTESSGMSGGTFNSSSGTTSGSSTTYSQNFQIALKHAVLPAEITGLPLAYAETDQIHGYCFNPDVGAFRFNTDFLRYFRDVPASPVEGMPLRPAEQQILKPWTLEDLRRLKLELTPELATALDDTWSPLGGIP